MGIIRNVLNNIKTDIKNITTVETTSIEEKRLCEWLGIHTDGKSPQGDVTYFTCLKKLSGTMGGMPLKYYQKTVGKLEEAEKDKMAYLLTTRPNPFTTPSAFWNAVEMNRNHYGNAYVWKQYSFKKKKFGGDYEPVALWIMPSADVKVVVDDIGFFGNKGKIYYWYQDKYSGISYIFNEYEIMHFTTEYTFNGIIGLAVQDILKATVQGNIESQDFLNKLYKNGLTASAVLEYTGELNEKAKQKLRESFENLGSGSLNAGRILPVPLGFKVTPLNIKLSDAQFIELKKYSALQLAGAFGIKPHQINNYDKSSYNSNEQQQLNYLVDTTAPILKRYEEEINYKCLDYKQIKEGFYFKFNEKVMLRTDSKTQAGINSQKVDKGMKTINECRADDDLPPVEGGDIPIVNGTYVPLKCVGQQYSSIADSGKE